MVNENSFYKKHIFICTNQKDNGKKCCSQAGGLEMWRYAKQRCKEEGLTARQQVRVSKSGCLGRCAEGPCLVVYPQATWYNYHTKEDIDKIIDNDLIDNRTVDELLITNDNVISTII